MPLDLARRMSADGLLSDEEVVAVVARRAAFSEPAPLALRALGLVSDEALESIFARLGYVATERVQPSAHAATLPPGMQLAFWAVPLGDTGESVVVAMVDPTDEHALHELEFHLQRAVEPRAAGIALMRAALEAVPTQAEAPRNTMRVPAAPAVEVPDFSMQTAKLPSEALESLAEMATGRRRHTPAYGHQAQADVKTTTLDLQAPSPPSATQTPRGAGLPSRLSPAGAAIGSNLPSEIPPRSRSSPPRDSAAPIPLQRRRPLTRRPSAIIPLEAMHAVAEMQNAPDRDAIAKLAARGMTTVARRAAFFVVKRGVVQGWEGAVAEGALDPGLTPEALRNLWIPITSESVFREANERGVPFIGPLTGSTADMILGAALGGRPQEVLLAPIVVRGRVVAFVYADTLRDRRTALARGTEIAEAATEAFARWLADGRGTR